MEPKHVRKDKKRISEVMRDNITKIYQGSEKKAKSRQNKYLKALCTKELTRNDNLVNTSLNNANKQLRIETNILKSELWVASGREHQIRTNRLLPYINCHVQCQERLSEQIRELRGYIRNVERAMSRVTRQVYDLNRQTVPDSQHQRHVAKARKHLQMFENRLEIGMRRECDFTARNEVLRLELISSLNDRTLFNDAYIKMVRKLNFGKKYLTELIEYALGKFESCVNAYERMEALQKRTHRDDEIRKIEMQALMRNIEADMELAQFYTASPTRRSLTQVKNKRGKKLAKMERHQNKINLYNSILEKILDYTNSHNVKDVIAKYQNQESRFYSYYNYANELDYHMTLLNNSLGRLYTDIEALKQKNRNSAENDIEVIDDLERKLEEKRTSNEELRIKSETNDARIDKLLTSVEMIKNECRITATTPKLLLDNLNKIDLVNMRHYLKLIQDRLIEVVGAMYVLERMDDRKSYRDFVVKDVFKVCDWPTPLDEVVLTQQCPECAEGEVLNVEDTLQNRILSKDEIRKNLYEKIHQPEMQYRLHSLSQCRLPRSRLIAASKLNIRGA